MKQSHVGLRSPKQAGFTLVELLVVMVIIAILISVLLPAVNSALRSALRVKAGNLGTQIQTAVTSYYTEYSLYPVPSSFAGSGDFYASDTDGTDWAPLIEGLSGNLSPASPATAITSATTGLNTRNIPFLQLKASDVSVTAPIDCPVNPLPYSKSNPYFNIVMDSDYSGLAGDSGGAKTAIMPNFGAYTAVGTPTCLTAGTTVGVAVWANCNITTVTTKWNPSWFVHTY